MCFFNLFCCQLLFAVKSSASREEDLKVAIPTFPQLTIREIITSKQENFEVGY
jgi:hypothetical protein